MPLCCSTAPIPANAYSVTVLCHTPRLRKGEDRHCVRRPILPPRNWDAELLHSVHLLLGANPQHSSLLLSFKKALPYALPSFPTFTGQGQASAAAITAACQFVNVGNQPTRPSFALPLFFRL